MHAGDEMTAKLLLALLALLCFALLNMVTPIAATESTSLPMTDETAQVRSLIQFTQLIIYHNSAH